MVDVKRLKGAVDLAQLTHDSYQNEDSKAALEAAKGAYALALEADDDDDDVVTDAEIDAAQARLDAIKADKAAGKKVTKPGITKASTTRTNDAAAVAPQTPVPAGHQPMIVDSTASEVVISKGEGSQAGQDGTSPATQVAIDLAAEKKSA